MNQSEDQLSRLLREHRDIEPTDSFEQDVLRRIRISQAERPVGFAWIGWLRDWAGQPAVSLATAVVVALLIGAWAGRSQAPSAAPGFVFLVCCNSCSFTMPDFF